MTKRQYSVVYSPTKQSLTSPICGAHIIKTRTREEEEHRGAVRVNHRGEGKLDHQELRGVRLVAKVEAIKTLPYVTPGGV